MSSFEILIITAVAAAVILTVINSRKIHFFWSLLLTVAFAAGMVLYVYADQTQFFAVRASDGPEKTVTSFFDALMAEDYAMAYSCLDDRRDLGFSGKSNNENTDKVMEAAKESFQYRLSGAAQVEKLTAVQQVEISCLDVAALMERVSSTTQAEMEKLVQERKRAEVYDENKQFRPEISREAYSNALTAVLEDSGAFVVSETVPVKLVFTDGEWHISFDAQMLDALLGEIGV